MGTVTRLRAGAGKVTLGAAVDAYLETLRHPESAGTARVYSGPLRTLAERFGEDRALGTLDPAAVAGWFGERWGERSPARWNGALNALRSAVAYWTAQGWTASDPTSSGMSRLAMRSTWKMPRMKTWLSFGSSRVGVRNEGCAGRCGFR
jgi:hypothetical protein